MYEYIFSNGEIITSRLKKEEMLKRMRRLDVLRVLTEQYECEEMENICKKASKAYDKADDFMGIIRLTNVEKDCLAYRLEDELLSEEEIEAIEFYCKREMKKEKGGRQNGITERNRKRV